MLQISQAVSTSFNNSDASHWLDLMQRYSKSGFIDRFSKCPMTGQGVKCQPEQTTHTHKHSAQVHAKKDENLIILAT